MIHHLPNLQHLVCVGSLMKLDCSIKYFHDQTGTNLETITWPGCDSSISPCGFNLESLPGLSSLFLDDYHIKTRASVLRRYMAEDEASNKYMFQCCRQLQRISIKRASWIGKDMAAPEPLPQDMLIKMVRHHPALQWIRSDLTAENVNMLKQERPEITFVWE